MFGAVKLETNVNINKHKYSEYGIGFKRGGTLLVPSGSGRNVIIFGADMSSFVHIDNTGKDVLILGKGSMQWLDGNTLTAEKTLNHFYRG